MTQETPRLSARQRVAPAGDGWDRLERCDWEAIAAALPTPWPMGAMRCDLRYWSGLQRIGRVQRPGYRELAARWGVGEKAARLVCADVLWWSDQRFGDEDPARAKRAQQGRSEGADGAQQGRTEGAPEQPAVVIPAPKGRSEGADGAQQGRSKGAKRAPNNNREQRTDDREQRQKSMSDSAEAERVDPAPVAAALELDRAVKLFERLERLRQTRHAGARGLSRSAWVPKLRSALARMPAQDLLDAYVWLLYDHGAAWHRGEDMRNPSPDRTIDFACVLRHPEYALRRTWVGPQAPTPDELEEQRESAQRGAGEPAWVARQAQSPTGRRAAAERARKQRDDDEARAYLARVAEQAASAAADFDVPF